MFHAIRLAALVFWALLVMAGQALAVPAFSGAEGWGAVTGGGRGGQVIHVTNLNDSGPGSFREAATASGPRTVVFDVAGQINLLSEVNILNPYLTIAGQTAPGDGITIAGETLSLDIHDVIVRYVRFRRGAIDENRKDDALGSDRTNSNDLGNPKTGNIIIDHVSASWGLDENLSVYRSKLNAAILPGGSTVLPTRNVTLQWSISSEALNPFRHAFGSTLGGAGVNQHHNLWASNTGRNPSISFSHFMDFRNNVLFNWMHRSVDGAGPEAHVNMINNYYRPGPATGYSNAVEPQPIPELKVLIVEPEIRGGVYYGGVGWWYVDGNVVDGSVVGQDFSAVSADNWEGESEVAPGVYARGVQFEQAFPIAWARVLTPHTHVEFPDDPDDPFDDDGSGGIGTGNPLPIPDLPTIATQTAEDAYLSVLAGAGASLVRDAVDLRIVDSVTTGIATAGPRGDGIITDISQVGGYPVIPYVERGPDWDTDQDGMPDYWEDQHGLDPDDADDRNDDFDTDGYTNLEDYLNDVGAFQAVQDIVWDGALGDGRYARIENWDIAFQPSRYDVAVINNGTVTVDAVGQHAGTIRIGSNPGDNATLSVTAGWLKVEDAFAGPGNGDVIIGADDGATAALNLSGGELSVERLTKGAGGSMSFTGGVLHASEVDFNLVNDGGTLAPGNSTGHTLIDGDYDQLAGSTLEIEIAALADFDTVDVTGTADLAGLVNVILDSGFALHEGDSFEILLAGTLVNSGIALAAGGDNDLFTLDVNTSTGIVTLHSAIVGLPGDYNNDGTVDAADYSVWRDTLGSTSDLRANGDDTGASENVIDEADYAVWKANFGMTAGAGSSPSLAAAVPEPASLTILLLGGVLILLSNLNNMVRRGGAIC